MRGGPGGRLARAGSLGLAGAALVAFLPAAAGQSSLPVARSALTTTASGPVTRRGQITDTAHLSGTVRATGTIIFSVYGPHDPNCTGTPSATSTRMVSGNGSYVSAAYTAPAAGEYRLRARYTGDPGNASAQTGCGDPAESVTVSDPPPAVLGRSFQVGPLSGRVSVMRPAGRPGASSGEPAAGFVALLESLTLPVGSVIDATAGVARITSATARRGQVQVGDFGAGRFRVIQRSGERGLTELDLEVSRPATGSCAAGAAGRARTAARRGLSRRLLALLRSSVAGRFRTRGRFSSATVRGTDWDMVERCDGTLTRVRRGVVEVADLRRGQIVVLRAGRSYLARAR